MLRSARRDGCRRGEDGKIGTFVEIQKNSSVGKRCKISSHTFICEGVTIEDEVFIGHGVMFRGDCRAADTMAYYGDKVGPLTLDRPFKASGKKVTGLETVEQQLGYFDTLSEDAQRAAHQADRLVLLVAARRVRPDRTPRRPSTLPKTQPEALRGRQSTGATRA